MGLKRDVRPKAGPRIKWTNIAKGDELCFINTALEDEEDAEDEEDVIAMMQTNKRKKEI